MRRKLITRIPSVTEDWLFLFSFIIESFGLMWLDCMLKLLNGRLYLFVEKIFFLYGFKSYRNSRKLCDVLPDLVPFVQYKKRKKHPWRSVTFTKVAGLACNFTKSNILPWVFFTFFKLCKWYQIAQHITYNARRKLVFFIVTSISLAVNPVSIYQLKINNKILEWALFCCLYHERCTYFIPCCSGCMINFEHVITCWERASSELLTSTECSQSWQEYISSIQVV